MKYMGTNKNGFLFSERFPRFMLPTYVSGMQKMSIRKDYSVHCAAIVNINTSTSRSPSLSIVLMLTLYLHVNGDHSHDLNVCLQARW